MRELISDEWLYLALAAYMALLSAYAIHRYPEGRQRKILIWFLSIGVIAMCCGMLVNSTLREKAMERFRHCAQHLQEPGCAAHVERELQRTK